MSTEIKELRFIYQTEPIDQWGGWIPLATMKDGDIEFYDFGINDSDLKKFFNNEQVGSFASVSYNELKKIAYDFLNALGVNKEYPIDNETIYRNENELRDEGWLFYSGIPKDGLYLHHIILAYKIKNNGSTYIGSPFKLPWIEGTLMFEDPHDMEQEEINFLNEIERKGEIDNLKRVKGNIDKLLPIIESSRLREDDNMEHVAWLFKLSEVSDLLNEYGFNFTYDSKWDEIYMRDFEGEKITDEEIKELYNYVKEVKEMVDFCYNKLC
jgi:hypothetical protein